MSALVGLPVRAQIFPAIKEPSTTPLRSLPAAARRVLAIADLPRVHRRGGQRRQLLRQSKANPTDHRGTVWETGAAGERTGR